MESVTKKGVKKRRWKMHWPGPPKFFPISWKARTRAHVGAYVCVFVCET